MRKILLYAQQGGRRYAQASAGADHLFRTPVVGSTVTVVVGSDNALLSIDLPEMGGCAPGTIVLGGGGQGGMT